jgi:hypothetical protein
MAGTVIADIVQAASTSQLNIKNGVALTPPTISDVNNVAIGTFCRAWVNFNGQGTVAIRASFNVSSITDNGAGQYQVNFTNSMVDINYVVLISTSGGTAGQFPGTPGVNAFPNLQTRAPLVNNFIFDIVAWNNTAVGIDEPWLNVAIFR